MRWGSRATTESSHRRRGRGRECPSACNALAGATLTDTSERTRERGQRSYSSIIGIWMHMSCCSVSTSPRGTGSCRACSRRRMTGRTWFHPRTFCRRGSLCVPISWRRSVSMSLGAWTLRSSAGSTSSTSPLASRRSTSRKTRSTRTPWLPSRSSLPRTGWCATWWRTRSGCSGCAPTRTRRSGRSSSTW